MTETQQQDHPLHGVGLDTLLGELVRHYGWEILAEQININAFKNYPSFDSSLTFLRKTRWAREKLEAFYLYKFKQCPLPDDEQHQLPPRERATTASQPGVLPAKIQLGDPEFFDDPLSGPVFPSRKSVQKTRTASKSQPANDKKAAGRKTSAVDPWANWKNKNKKDKNR